MKKRLRHFWIRIVSLFDLRKACVMVYGDHFGEMYDAVLKGIPIGNMQETELFLSLVWRVKNGDF